MSPTDRIAALRRAKLNILADEFAAIVAQRDSLLRMHARQDVARFAPTIGVATTRDRCDEAGIDLGEAERVTGMQLGRRAG